MTVITAMPPCDCRRWMFKERGDRNALKEVSAAPLSVRAFSRFTSLCALCCVNVIVPDKEPLCSPRFSQAGQTTQSDFSF